MSSPGRAGAAALLAAALVVGCSGEGPATTRPAQLEAETFTVGGSPWGVVADGDGVWVSDAAGGRVVRLAADGRVLQERAVPAADLRAAGLVLVRGSLWVAQLSGAVTVLPADGGAARSAAGAGEAADVAVGPDSAWLPGHGPEGALAQLDARSLRTMRRVELPESPFQVELDRDELWVAGLDRRVFRLDARTGVVRDTVDAGPAPRGLAVTADAVWVSVRDAGELVRVDRADPARTRPVVVGGQPWPVAADEREVWGGAAGRRGGARRRGVAAGDAPGGRPGRPPRDRPHPRRGVGDGRRRDGDEDRTAADPRRLTLSSAETMIQGWPATQHPMLPSGACGPRW